MPKILNLTLPLDVTPHRKIESIPFPSCLTPSPFWLQTTCWKKVSLINFRQILPQILPVAHIFSFIITTYLKNIIGNKSLTTKQCPAELSPWIMPSVSPILPKMYHLLSSCLVALPCMDCPAHSPKLTIWGKPCRWGKNLVQQQKKCPFLAPENHSSPNSNFHVITQYKLHL